MCWNTIVGQCALPQDKGIQSRPTLHCSATRPYLHVDGRTLSQDAELGSSTVRLNKILQIGRHHVLDKEFDALLANHARSPRIAYPFIPHSRITVAHFVLHIVRFRYRFAADQALLVFCRFLMFYVSGMPTLPHTLRCFHRFSENWKRRTCGRIVGIGGSIELHDSLLTCFHSTRKSIFGTRFRRTLSA